MTGCFVKNATRDAIDREIEKNITDLTIFGRREEIGDRFEKQSEFQENGDNYDKQNRV